MMQAAPPRAAHDTRLSDLPLLLVLRADPTADIANARKVRALVRGGVYRTLETLHAAASR